MHLADYGFKEWLSGECLRPIKRKHLRVMWSAQRCHLVDICPVSGDNWSQETCEVLLNLVNEKKCFIRNKVFLCLQRHQYVVRGGMFSGCPSSCPLVHCLSVNACFLCHDISLLSRENSMKLRTTIRHVNVHFHNKMSNGGVVK